MSSKKQEVRSRKSVADLRSKSIDELQKLLAIARADLLEAQKSLKANELANPRVVRMFKRDIARLLMIINEVESNKKEEEAVSNKQEAVSQTKNARLKTSHLRLTPKPTKEVL